MVLLLCSFRECEPHVHMIGQVIYRGEITNHPKLPLDFRPIGIPCHSILNLLQASLNPGFFLWESQIRFFDEVTWESEKNHWVNQLTLGENNTSSQISNLGGGNSNIFLCSLPKIGEDEPNLTSIFFRGVENQPPSRSNLSGANYNDSFPLTNPRKDGGLESRNPQKHRLNSGLGVFR